ncbi:hypothetical protein MOMA_03935 [Moraxella macacae 0408225]|uniref:Uncharacterized protein n=1 Tax=Moraxella macacae 0408225 TaxID=1230338 RepID=L2FAN2_9GAMM|nr:HAD hydrolase family protein [Moraxella macacae]ELA09523.1 hypothetical protein MOMA_03935 [Moraxella macacae 0408225]
MHNITIYDTFTPYALSPQNRPYALMDLDDTLFQTLRKIQPQPLSDNLTVASVNKQGKALSFFSKKQHHFFNWLSQTTELIPVTARDSNEILRVKLPFHSWQVLTHGAVIVSPKQQIDSVWQQQIYTQLNDFQDNILTINQFITQINQQQALELQLTLHDDKFNHNDRTLIYLAIKHKQRNETKLANFCQQLPTILSTVLPNFTDDFYIHLNTNNLAILPKFIHKKHAVNYLLHQHLDKNRPCFGFGDSVADLPFLQILDWYGTPNRGQLHTQFAKIDNR